MGLRVMSQWALAALWQMPLASAGDLAGFCGRDRAGVYRDLRELESKGFGERYAAWILEAASTALASD